MKSLMQCHGWECRSREGGSTNPHPRAEKDNLRKGKDTGLRKLREQMYPSPKNKKPDQQQEKFAPKLN